MAEKDTTSQASANQSHGGPGRPGGSFQGVVQKPITSGEPLDDYWIICKIA